MNIIIANLQLYKSKYLITKVLKQYAIGVFLGGLNQNKL